MLSLNLYYFYRTFRKKMRLEFNPLKIMAILFVAALITNVYQLPGTKQSINQFFQISNSKQNIQSNDQHPVKPARKIADSEDDQFKISEVGSARDENPSTIKLNNNRDENIDDVYQTKRLLQVNASKTNNTFLIVSTVIFQSTFQVGRNLILIGLFTNMIDVFLPYIILSESFMMLAFWTNQKHYLTTLYYNVFNSPFDLLNALRLIFAPTTDSSVMPQLSQYKFGSILLFNITGQFFVAVILLAFTILSKLSTVCIKNERLRTIAAQLRPIWNSYFFAIFPRIATLTGIHWRMIGMGAGYDILNIIVCSLLSIAIIFFFVQLLVQIRKINSKVQYIQESREEIGLVTRIDYKRQFEFDCLQYSMLHYPIMNYIRLCIYYLPIGLSYDFYYCSYGGAIVGQLFMMMIEVSCTGYVNRRDKILYPIQNFLLMIVHLCIITIGLAQSVQHSEVSQIAETVSFSILIFVIGTSVLGIVLDTIQRLRKKFCQKKKGEQEQQEEEATNKFVRELGKGNKDIQEAKRSEGTDDIDFSNQDDELQDSDIIMHKQNLKGQNVKIKKVRKGKII